MKRYYKEIAICLVFILFYLFQDSIYAVLFPAKNDITITNEMYQTLKNEYDALLEYQNLSKENWYEGVATKILFRDPLSFHHKLTLPVGEEQNIRVGSAVVNDYGFIGVIDSISKNRSTVLMLLHPSTSLSVQVGDIHGVLKYENNQLIIDSVTSKSEIEKDALVYTSGYTNIPGGLLVGKVEEVVEEKLGIEKKLLVEPVVHFDSLSYVQVLHNRGD